MVIIFIMVLVSFIFLLCHWQRTGLTLLALSLLTIVLTGLPFLPNALLGDLEQQYSAVHKPDPKVHWIVVLGAGMVYSQRMPADMQLSTVSTLRLMEAVRLYKSLPDAKLILSGGKTVDQYWETQFRQRVANLVGVPDEDIMSLPAARNTHEEAEFTAKILSDQPFYLVTSASHMPRAMRLFKKQGLHPLAAPSNFIVRTGRRHWYHWCIPSASSWIKLSIVFYEKIGLAWATLRGYV